MNFLRGIFRRKPKRVKATYRKAINILYTCPECEDLSNYIYMEDYWLDKLKVDGVHEEVCKNCGITIELSQE